MSRKKGREIALQILYQMEMNKQKADEALKLYKEHFLHNLPEDDNELLSNPEEINRALEFAHELIIGVEAHKNFIDNIIQKYTFKWPLHRLNATDRNILRIAIFEMFFRPDIPEVVSISEAVELAKIYGTDESPSFINGVLDNILKKELYHDKKEKEQNFGS